LSATEPAFSGVEVAAGAGDSVRSALAFFLRADLDSAGAEGFWTVEAAMLKLSITSRLVADKFETKLFGGCLDDFGVARSR